MLTNSYEYFDKFTAPVRVPDVNFGSPVTVTGLHMAVGDQANKMIYIYGPYVQNGNITVDQIKSDGFTISWKPGNGSARA